MTLKRKSAMGNDGRKGKLSIIASVGSTNYFHVGFVVLLLYIYLPGGEAHISSLIESGDVLPPRLNQLRNSRGPTVPIEEVQDTGEISSPSPHIHTSIHQMPSFQQKYLRQDTEVHSRNPVYTRLDGDRGGSQEYSETMDGNGLEDANATPTYLQYISARALSNMPEFFKHLRENLHALQQEEDEYSNQEGDIGQPDRRGDPGTAGEDYAAEMPNYYTEFQPERSVATRPRWKPPASGHHSHNIRSFVQPPTEEETYLRRANNYNPSWLYTNLGLGRRRR